jgi:hypothetical protein
MPAKDDDTPLDAASDADASRAAPWWDAGGKTFSAIYWGAIAIFCGSLWRTQSLPFVDYPQHLALASTLRRMLASGSPEQTLFETNLASYNSLFHVLVAGLNLIVPIDSAGKLVLCAYFVLTGYASLALLRATGRPRGRAFLVLTVLAGYAITWGFVNYSLGVAIQLVVLARVLDEVPANEAPRAYWKRVGITAALAVLGAYTHLLGSALAYMLILVVIVTDVQTEEGSLAARLVRALRRGAPLVPAILYCGAVYWRQTHAAYQNFEYGQWEGNDLFALKKIQFFTDYAAGMRADHLDSKIVLAAILLLLVGALFRDRKDARHPALAWIFMASLFAYVVIPHVFWATNYVFERISFLVVITAIVWAPRATPAVDHYLRIAYVSAGCAAAGNFFTIMGAAGRETADMDAVIAEGPNERHVIGLVNTPRIASFQQVALLHTPSYYVARHGGEDAFSFKRTMSLPIHYKMSTMPPAVPDSFEWRPNEYRADTAYARYFDLVLYKSAPATDGNDDTSDPRDDIWGSRAGQVKVLAHHGAWWLLDARSVQHDDWLLPD